MKEAIILDAEQGQFELTWESTDLVEGLEQQAYFELVDGSGDVASAEGFLINVEAKFE